MYVACRRLNLGNGRWAEIGQPVPEASHWPYSVLKAHIDLEWIRFVANWVDPNEVIEVPNNAEDVVHSIIDNEVEKVEPVPDIKAMTSKRKYNRRS